jgi:sugar O-acyltransferase (sialic acid O-acetyltransferase NeuD family)
MQTATKLVILGAGGFAREVLWLVREIRRDPRLFQAVPEPIGFIDASPGESPVLGLPVLGDDTWAFGHLDPGRVSFVCAIGDNRQREKVCNGYTERGYHAINLIHPSVRFSDEVDMGEGCILCAGAVLTTQVKLGSHIVVNLNSTVGHDVSIGDFATLHPGCHVNGNVSIGRSAEIGSGAVILPGNKVGHNTLIGAGSVVTEDMPDGMVCMGMPCKPVRPV